METVLGLLRHLLTFGGGMLVGKGYIDDATAQAVAGAVVTIVGAVWSALAKSNKFPFIK